MDSNPTVTRPAPHVAVVTPTPPGPEGSLAGSSVVPGSSTAAELAWQHDVDGCAVIGLGGIVTAANPAFAGCIGRPGDPAVGLDVFEVFAPDDVRGPLGDDGPTGWWPVAGLDRDDVPFLAELSTSALHGHERVLRVRRRLPTIRLVDPSDDTVASSRHALAHALSHDIRGRLGVVTGFLDLSFDCDTPETDSELVARAAAAAHVADRMMQRLVHFVRLGEAVFRLQPTPLDGVLAEAASTVAATATVRIGAMPTVFGDPAQLVEVFAELFHNAVEYAGDQAPTISVDATATGRWCEIRVTDDGPGIDGERTDEVFVVFRQLQPRNWERGLGMGLPICRRIIDGHGGTLRLLSTVGEGTTAVLRLALAGPPG